MPVREWGRISLAFSFAWLACAALSFWSLRLALGSGSVRSSVPVSMRTLVITQAAPWALAALLTPLAIWHLGRLTARGPGTKAWAVAGGGVAFLLLHTTILPVLAALLDRGEWTWPRWDGPVARVWISSLSVALQYSVMAATMLMRQSRALAQQLERDLSDAQLRVLRTSLQPHFLFNALHSVSAILDRSPADARRALAEIGHLLRWSLEHDHRQVVTVAQELDVVERYLGIERLRMGERLRVHYSVTAAELHASIPSFLLQPLVENAVRHGIAPSEGAGDLHILIRGADGDVEVVVRNSIGGSPRDPGVSLGQQHVRDRLRSLYGARGSFVQTEQDGWYTVTMRWPQQAVLHGYA